MNKPEQNHIDFSLGIEKKVPKEEMALYLECMNNVPMSQRVSDIELHDGCILTNFVYLHVSKLHPHNTKNIN
jgi:hypothetical protein